MTEIKAGNFNQPQVITRTGEAPRVPDEKYVELTGTLKAPGDYLQRKIGGVEIIRVTHSNLGYSQHSDQMYYPEDSVLCVKRQEKCLVLKLNIKNYVTDIITGELTDFGIWKDLKVNTGDTWAIDSLRKFLKRIKFYFSKPEQHTEFLSKLQNFVAKVESNYKDTHVSGETELSSSRKLMDGAIMPEFRITAPIYVGYEKLDVRVEVFADVSDGSVKFMLESQDLFTLQEEKAEEYMNQEIKRIDVICDGDMSIVNIN